ncbi:MAG: glycosyl transferase family 1 [Bryobacterales bacterium]|nr:glycosyl transferase family 1 [Bryobacterales bacterium]
MKILNVAYPFARLGEGTAGGAEQVLSMLDLALWREGHESYVVACEGSAVCGQLLPTPLPQGGFGSAARRSTWTIYRSAIAHAIEKWKPDLVHMHGIDFPQYLPSSGAPVIATLHLPPAWYDAGVFEIRRPQTWLHCVSRLQQDACPKPANLLPFIANGVPENLPAKHVSRRKLAVSLGRICPEKGYHLALAASQKAGMPFLLAGEVYGYEEHQRYFREQILPHCGKEARFIGAVGPRRKRRLLSAATCLLVPSLAPETSSLVAMEAAMCGTPVVAFRAGALPEIVQDKVTGFLVDDVWQMAEAIHECRHIDPVICRNSALVRFSGRVMVSSYLQMYERLIGR